MKTVYIIGVLLLFLVAGYIISTQGYEKLPQLPEPDELDPVKRGGNDLILYEFTDYQCPACRAFALNTYPVLMQKYGDRITYIVIDLPLESIHPLARYVAKYVNCTYKLYGSDEAFSLKQYLFQTQNVWTQLTPEEVKDHIRSYLKDKFNATEQCSNSLDVDAEISEDLSIANKFGFRGTPSFIVVLNGVSDPSILRTVVSVWKNQGVDIDVRISGDKAVLTFTGAVPPTFFDSLFDVLR